MKCHHIIDELGSPDCCVAIGRTFFKQPALGNMMEFWLSSGSLLASAFISATLFPAASEVVLVVLLLQQPDIWLWWWAVASVGNTLGSLTSYAIGYRLPILRQPSARATAWLQQYGAWALLVSWLPIVGDALPLAAGYLRLPWKTCVCCIALGKMMRYAVLVWGVLIM